MSECPEQWKLERPREVHLRLVVLAGYRRLAAIGGIDTIGNCLSLLLGKMGKAGLEQGSGHVWAASERQSG